jgi:uncharacterized protein (DUF2235 family)
VTSAAAQHHRRRDGFLGPTTDCAGHAAATAADRQERRLRRRWSPASGRGCRKHLDLADMNVMPWICSSVVSAQFRPDRQPSPAMQGSAVRPSPATPCSVGPLSAATSAARSSSATQRSKARPSTAMPGFSMPSPRPMTPARRSFTQRTPGHGSATSVACPSGLSRASPGGRRCVRM